MVDSIGLLGEIYEEVGDADLLIDRLQFDREVIEKLKNGETYTLQCTKEGIPELLKKYGIEFKELLRHSMVKMLQKVHQGEFEEKFNKFNIKLDVPANYKLQDLTPEDEKIPRTFDCVVTALDSRKTFVERAVLTCDHCGDSELVPCNEDRVIPSTRCLTPKCKGNKMTVNTGSMVTRYIQTCILQEPLEQAKRSSPVSFVGKLIGDDVGMAYMGQRKKITGVFKTKYKPTKEEYDINIDVMEMIDLDDVELAMPSDELLKKLKEQSKEDGFLDKIAKCFAPHIYGNTDIKKSIMLMLAGGVNGKKRGDINMLLIGDPSMAKSELLKFGNEVTQKSMFTNGRGSSGAGLTIAVVKDERIGGWMASSGVYPLCNEGFVFVDEFDKMTKEDRSAMHEVLEQGTCSIAKAGIQITQQAKCSTLAAANPRYGKYDSSLSLMDNIDLPIPILSRFDMIWLILDKVSDVDDTFKAEHILSYYGEGKQAEITLDVKELLSYVNYVRKLKPVLTAEASTELIKIYKKMRETWSKQGDKAVPVGVRQLESLVRMSMAHAKLYFKDKVDIGDVCKVTELFKASFKSHGIDLDSGVITQGILPTKLTKEQEFRHVFNDCKDKLGHVSVEDVIKKLGEMSGWNSEKAKNKWKMYVTNGNLMVCIDGRYRWDD